MPIVRRRGETALVVFAFLVLTGPPRLRARELNAALDSPFSLDPAAMVQVITWVGSAAVVTFLLLCYPRYRTMLRSLLRYGPTRWYLTFAGLGIISMAWSTVPLYTLFFAGKIIIGVLVVSLLAVHGRRASFDRPVRVLLAVSVVKLSVMVILFPINAPLVVAYTSASPLGWRLSGGPLLEDYGNSSLFLGMWLLSIGLFSLNRKRRRRAMVGYGFTSFTLLLGQGRTQILTGLLALLIMLALTPRSRSKTTLLVLAAAGLAFVIAAGRLDTLMGVATRGGEGVASLTGRTDAFDYLMPLWHIKPILGWGYAAGTRTALLDFQRVSGLGIGAGHDILSTTLVDLGVVGVAAISLVFLSTWHQLVRLWRRTRRRVHERVVVAYLCCIAVQVAISSGFGTGIEQHLPPFLALLGVSWAFHVRLLAADAVRQRPAGDRLRTADS